MRTGTILLIDPVAEIVEFSTGHVAVCWVTNEYPYISKHYTLAKLQTYLDTHRLIIRWDTP